MRPYNKWYDKLFPIQSVFRSYFIANITSRNKVEHRRHHIPSTSVAIAWFFCKHFDLDFWLWPSVETYSVGWDYLSFKMFTVYLVVCYQQIVLVKIFLCNSILEKKCNTFQLLPCRFKCIIVTHKANCYRTSWIGILEIPATTNIDVTITRHLRVFWV